MALASSYFIWEIQTGGNDSYGGAFNASNANMATDGAATSATGASPVFTSASYTFIARDVGHWLFIKSGTNWRPGWYQIVSVSAGAATLNATAGQCPQYSGAGQGAYTGTTTGCASTASPTAATWSVDYSQSTPITYTDMVVGGSSTMTSAAQPFGKNMIGNVLSITGGTGFTVQRIEINSCTGTTASLYSGTGGTTSSTGGTGYLGGPMLTPGKVSGATANSYSVYMKAGTYILTTASANVAGGVISWANSGTNALPIWWKGYTTYRGDKSTRPIIQCPASGVTAVYIVSITGTYQMWENIDIDCNSGSGMSGIYASQFGGYVRDVKITNPRGYGLRMPTNNIGVTFQRIAVTGAGGTYAIAIDGTTCNLLECEVWGGSVTAFSIGGSGVYLERCIAAGISGGAAFIVGNFGQVCNGCVAYACPIGFYLYGGSGGGTLQNCIAEGNSGYGYDLYNAACGLMEMYNCAGYNNTSGNYNPTQWWNQMIINFISGSASFFVNAASGNFAPNNTAGAGALLRGTAAPATFPRGTSTSYRDVGAIQHQDAGGTAGSRLVGPSTLVTPGGLL